MKKGEPDLQIYHIIRFKCPVFDKRLQGIQKKQESMAHSKEKKSTRTVPEKDLMADLLDKHFNTVILKMSKN